MRFAKRTANEIKCNTLFRYVLQDHIWIGEIRSASYSQRGDMRNDRREGERRRTDEIIEPEQRSAKLAIVLHDDPDF